jgi:hypothetical protein
MLLSNKKNELLIKLITLVNFKIIILSDRSQTPPKSTCYIINSIHRNRKEISGCLETGTQGRAGEQIYRGTMMLIRGEAQFHDCYGFTGIYKCQNLNCI